MTAPAALDVSSRVLAEVARTGDRAAFGDLYDRYRTVVFRFVLFKVGNRQLAEDITADTFVRALNKIGSWEWQGRDPGAWFVTIARNLIADHWKSGRVRLEVTIGDVLDADRADHGSDPAGAVETYFADRALMAALMRLSAEQRECIVLRFLQGLSVAETAAAMGKNTGAIKSLQSRAVRALQRSAGLPPAERPWRGRRAA